MKGRKLRARRWFAAVGQAPSLQPSQRHNRRKRIERAVGAGNPCRDSVHRVIQELVKEGHVKVPSLLAIDDTVQGLAYHKTCLCCTPLSSCCLRTSQLTPKPCVSTLAARMSVCLAVALVTVTPITTTIHAPERARTPWYPMCTSCKPPCACSQLTHKRTEWCCMQATTVSVQKMQDSTH